MADEFMEAEPEGISVSWSGSNINCEIPMGIQLFPPLYWRVDG